MLMDPCSQAVNDPTLAWMKCRIQETTLATTNLSPGENVPVADNIDDSLADVLKRT